MKNQSILFLLAALITFTSCDDNNGNDPGQVINWSSYTISEGNYSDANGSITGYNAEENAADSTAYKTANGRKFVGYIQTSTVIGNRLYVMTNLPNKIEVMDLNTLESVGTINLSRDPVALASAGDDRAYITNLNTKSITIVDLKNMQETADTIAVGSNPYFAYNADGKVFVSNNGFGAKKTLSVIDTESDQVTDTLQVGYGPKQITEDPSGRLWVICEGYSPYQQPDNAITGGIYIVDPEQPAVVDSIKNGENPHRIAIDASDNQAFVTYTSGNLANINISTLDITDEDFIDHSFSTVGYSAGEQLLYVGKSNGYTQLGQTIRYNLEGTAIDSFSVGASPIEFHFTSN